jgi:hypothetical protein
MDRNEWWKNPNRDYYDPTAREQGGRGWSQGAQVIAPQILTPPPATVAPVDTGPVNSTQAFERGAKKNPFTPEVTAPSTTKSKGGAPGSSTIAPNPFTPVVTLPTKKVAAVAVNPGTPVFKNGGLVQGVKHYTKKC